MIYRLAIEKFNQMAGNVEIWMPVTVFLGMIILTWRMLRKSIKVPPGPRAWPIVGCLPFLPKVFPRELMLTKLAERYGELMLLRMGSRNTVVVSSARMAKEFLKTYDHLFANRPSNVGFQYLGFHDTRLFSMSNSSPLFKPTRRMFAAEIVAPRKVATTAHVRKEQVLKFLRAEVPELRYVNVSQAVSSLAVNLALCMSFGRDYDVDDAEVMVRSYRKMMALIRRRNISDFFPAIQRFDVQGIGARLKEAQARLRQSIAVLIERKKLEMTMCSTEEIQGGANDNLGVMTKLLSVEGPDRFSEEQLISVVFTMMLAGTATISGVVTEAMHEVVNNPDIYKRAIAELDVVVGTGRLVEESDFAKLPLIQNIIKETLRMHPPAPTLLPHSNFEACKVGGYHIPANSFVLINLYPIMRDPEFWDSPMEFLPDRWNDNLSKLKMQGSDLHFMPFGYGERQCPAINLGTTTVQYILAVCLQCISWRIPVDMERRECIATPQEPRKKEDLVLEGEVRVDPRLLEMNA